MEALQDKIAEIIAAKIASGELDEVIKAKIDNVVEAILDNTLNRWSPFAKALEEGIKQSINVDVDRLGLSGYNEMVAQLVQQKLDDAMRGDWSAKLSAHLDEILRHAPKTVKLSELFVEFAEMHKFDAEVHDWPNATMLVDDTEYGSRWVYFDPQPRAYSSKHMFGWSILVSKDGTIHSVSGSNERGRDREVLFGRPLGGMDGKLWQLFAGKSVLEFDVGEGLHEHFYFEDRED